MQTLEELHNTRNIYLFHLSIYMDVLKLMVQNIKWRCVGKYVITFYIPIKICNQE